MRNDMIGHNRASFDDVVEANLRRGLLLTQRDALIRCIEDPRLEPRHRVVLAKIIRRMNAETGTAFPGRKLIAEDTGMLAGNVPDPNGAYTEQVVSNAIFDLVGYGYLAQDKRAPKGGGRALSHYTLVEPAIEDVELEVQSYLQAIEARAPRPRPDITIRSDVRIADFIPRSEVNTEDEVSSNGIGNAKQPIEKARHNSDLTTGGDFTTGVCTVTSKEDNTQIASVAPAAPTAPRKREAKPRTKLPEDWKPAYATIAWAKENFAASDHQIAHEAEKFHSHHFGKGTRMADWPAAWRTWWFSGYHKIPRRKTASLAGQTSSDNAEIREFHDAFERARRDDEEAARCRH